MSLLLVIVLIAGLELSGWWAALAVVVYIVELMFQFHIRGFSSRNAESKTLDAQFASARQRATQLAASMRTELGRSPHVVTDAERGGPPRHADPAAPPPMPKPPVHRPRRAYQRPSQASRVAPDRRTAPGGDDDAE